MTIGEKIKARRRELGLTQSKVAGEQISRNMLSLIESGNASPSLETLYYIAEKLKVRVEYLVSEDISLQTFTRLDHEREIFEAYQSKNYEKALELIDMFGQNADILMNLGAECASRMAQEKVRGGSLASGRVWISRAEEYIARTTFDTSLIRSRLAIISSIAKNIQSPKLNFEQEAYEELIREVTGEEYYHYFIGDTVYSYRSKILKLHMDAKALMRVRNYVGAIALLTEAEEEKNQENYDAYVFFGIYNDLENCYKELLDFEKAYRYATKKMSMMEYFKS